MKMMRSYMHVEPNISSSSNLKRKWKGFATGTLRLTKSKTIQKAQMVIRTDSGKVQLNVRVAKGMTFTERTETAEGKGHLFFNAIQDEEIGLEKILMG